MENLKELDNRVYEIIASASDKVRAEQALDYYLYEKGNVFSLMELALSEAINGNYVNYKTLEKAFDYDCVAHGLREYSLIGFCMTTGLYHLFKREHTVTKRKKHLYVIKMSNGSVKIGIACDTERRFRQITSSSGMSIESRWESELIENAYMYETALHKRYKEKRLKGEYFDIDFDEAVLQAQQIAMIG